MKTKILFLGLFIPLFSSCSLTEILPAYYSGEGNSLYEKRKYSEAIAEFSAMKSTMPEEKKYIAEYNLGSSFFADGKYKLAEKNLQNALENCPNADSLCAPIAYNLGNTLFRMGEEGKNTQERVEKWEQSIEAYETALKKITEETPEEVEKKAKENKEYVEKLLKDLQKDMPKNQQNSQNKNEEKNKSDNKKNSEKKNEQKDGENRSPKNTEDKNEDKKSKGQIDENLEKKIQEYMKQLQDTEQNAQRFFNQRQEENKSNDPFGQDEFFQRMLEQYGVEDDTFSRGGDNEDVKDW